MSTIPSISKVLRAADVQTRSSTLPSEQARDAWSRWGAGRLPEIALWAVVPIVMLGFVFTRHRHTYFFYDEWALIHQVVFHPNSAHAALESFNGHLWAVNYVVYLAQVRWFGIGGHLFVFSIFCLSLLALHLALSVVLRALELPSVVAVTAAAVVVYFGRGAQNMVFEVQLGPNFALALVFVAALVVLQFRCSRISAGAVSAAFLLALACDSSMAVIGLVFVAVIAGFEWGRDYRGMAALALPALVTTTWYLWKGGETGPHVSVGFRRSWEFAVHLALRALGGLAGRGELVGALVLGAAGTLVAIALWRRTLPRASLIALTAGGGAAITATGLVAYTRAGIVGNDFTDFNRYIQLVAFFLLVALLPTLFQLLRRALPGRRPTTTIVATVALVAVFAANAGSLLDYRRTFEHWNTQTKVLVAASLAVLDHGCPRGRKPNPDAQPLGSLDPQISVALLEKLKTTGAAPRERPSRIDRRLARKICSTAA